MGSWVTPSAAASVKSPEDPDPAPCRLYKWDCYLVNGLTQQQGECLDPCVPSATTSPDMAGVQAGGRGAAVGRAGVVLPLLLQAFIRFCEQHGVIQGKTTLRGISVLLAFELGDCWRDFNEEKQHKNLPPGSTECHLHPPGDNPLPVLALLQTS